MPQLFAQPYDITANGFYFSRASEYAMNALSNRNGAGDIVEEYEIQFINGDDIDCALAKAWQLNQANFVKYLEKTEEWEDWQKLHFIIAVRECGFDHDQLADDPNAADITIYGVNSMRELAEQFVEEGLYGEIPNHLANYIDYDAIARDLEHDHSEVTIAGDRMIFHFV